MKTRDKILKILENSRGEYISGEEIATTTNVSRVSVCKHIKKLKESGYNIVSTTNRGYKLSNNTDILSEVGIRKYLNSDLRLHFEIYDTLNSTNTLLKNKAASISSDTIAIALEQSAGRGRFSRNFYSPKNSGLYMSIILKDKIDTKQATKITSLAAVAICEAIENTTGIDCSIKWVNDIYLKDKKICGILTEASMDTQSLEVEHIILGIGINIYKPKYDFPKEIQNIAGYLLDRQVDDIRNKLVAEFLNIFYSYYKNIENSGFETKYRNKNFILGKDIYVIENSIFTLVKAVDINNDCELEVMYKDGTTKHLNSGEISIRRL